MILVTGAAGKTGRAVVRALTAAGAAVRAFVHRPEQASIVKVLGVQDVVIGDMRDASVLQAAVQGARAIYHICPNVHAEEVSIGKATIAAARTAGVEHLVYHSVLHPQVEAMPHHWLKMRVEEHLFESGLSYTILQPAVYMQNILAQKDSIARDGTYRVPYSVDTRLGMVDLEDVAQAAAIVLSEPGHAGATYELAGPQALTQTEVAHILGRQLGRPVHAQAVPLDEWKRQAHNNGLDDDQIDTLLKMFGYYDAHGFWGNPRVLGWLLGRSPTTFGQFVERTFRSL